MYKKIVLIILLLSNVASFSLKCSDYLLNLNKKDADKSFNNIRMPLAHTTFDNAFVNTISRNIFCVKTTSNNDRIVLEYYDKRREIYFDRNQDSQYVHDINDINDIQHTSDVKKLLNLIRLIGNIKIETIGDFNYFESLYSPYYSSKEY